MFNQEAFISRVPQLVNLFHYYEEIPSSNDTAAAMVRNGAGSGTLVLAESQTKGRGRGGNVWISEKGKGLWFSLVLEPDIEKHLWSRFALAAGLAVADALAPFGVEAQLKWPNDVWVNGKKCAGILVESCEEALVVGVGINVFGNPSSVESTNVANEATKQIVREELLSHFIQAMMGWGSRCGDGFSGVVDDFNKRSVLNGQMIQLQRAGTRLIGRMLGVDANGLLMLESEHGVEAIAQAEQVRLLEV